MPLKKLLISIMLYGSFPLYLCYIFDTSIQSTLLIICIDYVSSLQCTERELYSKGVYHQPDSHKVHANMYLQDYTINQWSSLVPKLCGLMHKEVYCSIRTAMYVAYQCTLFTTQQCYCSVPCDGGDKPVHCRHPRCTPATVPKCLLSSQNWFTNNSL